MNKIKIRSLTFIWVSLCLGTYLASITIGDFELSAFFTKAWFMGAALVAVKLIYQQED